MYLDRWISFASNRCCYCFVCWCYLYVNGHANRSPLSVADQISMFGLFWLICTALLHFEPDNGPSFVCTLCCLDSIMFKILKIFKPELWNKLVFVSSKVHVFNFYTHFTQTTYTMHTAAQEEPDGHRKIQPVCSHNYTRQWSAGANAMNKPAKKGDSLSVCS